MIYKYYYFLIICFLLVQCQSTETTNQEGVLIIDVNGKSVVYKDGQKIEIKGVSGFEYLNEAKEAGASVIRTWDEQNAQSILDSAYKYNLYVILGIYIPEPRNGNNFQSQKFIDTQNKNIANVVNKFKNHPALLFWAVGNEVEISPSNYKIWVQLNNFIKLVKNIDGTHPVTTMIVPYRKSIAYANIFLRDLDVLSINVFGALNKVNDKLSIPIIGWNGPVMITEWGTNGPWEELEKTKWGAPIEKNSSKKAEIIHDRYSKYFLNPNSNIIGNFVFYWGTRQQYTDTWFSIFSKTGERSEIYYTMKNLWNKSFSDNLPPIIENILLDEKSAYDNIILSRGDSSNATVKTFDPDLDSLRFSWRILKDNIFYDNLDLEITKDPIEEKIIFKATNNEVSFKVNLDEGPYRLFVEIYDGNNNFAYSNIPFYVLD